jgi:chromosome segregation ATPase
MTLDHQIAGIKQKLQLLLKQHQQLQRENEQLKKELAKSREQLDARNQQLHQLQEQVDVVKAGFDSWTREEKAALEKRIDTYLKEIEKCMTLLDTAAS